MKISADSADYVPGPIESVPDDILACVPPNGVLHHYLWWVAKTTDTPPWFHVGAALVLLAQEACRRGFTIGDGEFRITPTVWAAIIGPSGHGKSTALRRAQQFADDINAVRHTPDPFVNAEGSMEGIFEALTDHYEADRDTTIAILYREEFARLLEPQRRDGVSALLCEIADGVPIKRHLRGARREERNGQKVGTKLRKPRICGLFATTYSALRRTTTADHIEGGLFSRFLFFLDEQKAENLRLYATDRPKAKDSALKAWINWLLWLDSQEALGTKPLIRIPPEVHELVEISLFETLQTAVRQHDILTPMYKRGIVQVYAVAGLFALSAGRTTVMSEDADLAVNLIERSLLSLRQLVPELGVSVLAQQMNLAFKAILAAGDRGVSRSRIYEIARGSKKAVDLILETLIDEGSVELRQAPKPKGPGRPPMLYVARSNERYGRDCIVPQGQGSASVVDLEAARAQREHTALDESEAE